MARTLVDGVLQGWRNRFKINRLGRAKAVIIRAFFRSPQGAKISMAYKHIKVPTSGEKIRVRKDFSLEVPDQPIIPYIEGDGTGVDITPVMLKVVDAAVQKAYGGKKKIVWMEMFAGEKSCRIYGENVWL